MQKAQEAIANAKEAKAKAKAEETKSKGKYADALLAIVESQAKIEAKDSKSSEDVRELNSLATRKIALANIYDLVIFF